MKPTDIEAMLKALADRLTALEAVYDAMVETNVARDEKVSEMRDHQDGQNDVLAGLIDKLEELTDKVHGRNRSAPVKRNMTDADAIRVMTGDVVGMGHKEAAEVIGLTYAQVYSCRLGFTFKHVHKELEKDPTYRNRWAKG